MQEIVSSLQIPQSEPYVKYAIAVDWGMLSVYLIVLLIALTAYSAKRSPTKANNVALVIPSVADEKVRDSLIMSLNHNRFLNIPIYVVIDEGAPLEGYLKSLNWIKVVVVPKDYRRDLFGKGRALRYFVENYVRPDMWYVFLDDDNLVLDDSFLYEIPYYERRGFVAFNPILMPRRGRSYLTFIMDFTRFLDDISFFRLFTGLVKRPYVGLHGELLGVKGSFLLKSNAFNVPSRVEDYMFAAEVLRLRGHTWQSRTRVSILSPNSVKDFIRQRSRWHAGILESWKRVPNSMKLMTFIKSFLRTVGIVGLWVLVPLTHSLLLLLLAAPTSAAYWFVYIYGVRRAGKLRYLLAVPAFWMLEGFGFIYGILKLRSRDFVVIDKSI
ncbi:egghead-like protein [Acidilobus saccharovorans 345-15]|uniref:Egghead-like protein n=1 Tax=Acidilobus saccharovorans (strain DSM 16705 / JCM 18335 / VKM B-2471 / 345-15) TaxID=666510 RepID=D9Q0M3_ACIS3|nr:glycosyltransferase family 2 protein [Acidilobus saccharovorans]ADL18861.1 egghead-like protein [Acidilobus saccharovorans 345-15]